MPKRPKTKDSKAGSGRQRAFSAKSVSLGDVALHSGVSTATVSRVINNPEKVAAKSRIAVSASIEALGYIPDGAARALASRPTGIIGAIVPTLDNALFAAGIQSLQRRLRQHDYTLIVASHEYDLAEELNEVKMLLRQGVDALLLVGSQHDPALLQLLAEKGVPYVNCWAWDSNSPQPYIGFDNRKAARKIADYLLDMGHVDLAVIAGRTENNDRASDRVLGIRDAIEARNLRLAPEKIIERSYSLKQGREAMRQLLQMDRLPTAVLCGNDILAMGAVAECQSSGIRIPDEISIAGFDDLDMSSQIKPALTTIHVPSAEMGEDAAEYLVAQIRQEPLAPPVEMGTRLMVRETTAKPRIR
ncbi:MAG: LacI family DNA-binding transcriptional regulator [Gammaproteobacteria bacterium]